MRALATALLAALLAMPVGAVDDPTITTDVGDSWYLAIGDSLAAGYQPVGDPQNDHKTRSGYPDQLWLMARGQYPNLHLRNLGCPGTNTETVRIDYPRCSYEHGSQLDEALWFIGAHRDELAFITIDLGFNDFECSDSFDCLLPGIEAIEQRLPAILDELQAAAPGVPIVGMNIYDPFLTHWFAGGLEATLAELSVGAITLVNESLATVYEAAGIPVADVASAFDIDEWDVLVPLAGHGDVPRNVALLCERTWQCHPPPLGPDRHPNVLGSRVMAETFAKELGLDPVGVELGTT
jgi:lysophospholipase L1-like esterase